MRRRLAVPIGLAILALAGCAAPSADPSTEPSDPPTDAMPTAPPAPDCDAFAEATGDYSASLGAALEFSTIDPADVPFVGELPAAVLDTGCFLADPLGDGAGAYVYLPDPDGSVQAEVEDILTDAGYAIDEAADYWWSPEAERGVTVARAEVNGGATTAGVSQEMLDLLGGGPVLFVSV